MAAAGRAGRGARRRRVLAATWLAAALSVQPVWAACVPPVPPDPASRPAKPALPAKPACADAKPGSPGCLGWESHSYNDAIKAYNAALPGFRAAAESYIGQLNAFVQASGDYARCEVKALQ
ncbi:MAG: hypothetical protein JWR86_170 [Enterovirga sp.]|nr:hypothetical protein [Enterovirga sp.]